MLEISSKPSAVHLLHHACDLSVHFISDNIAENSAENISFPAFTARSLLNNTHTHIFLPSTLTFIMKPVKVKAMFALPGKKGDEISDKCP